MQQPVQSFRTFYTIIITQTLSLVGSQMTGLALGIWIYEQTGDASPLTFVAFFSFLPRLLSASFAGLVADRYDRRYVMALSDLGQGIGTLFLLIVLLLNSFQIWHLYLVAVIQAVFGVLQAPAFQASVTMLIPDQHRDRANALQMISGPLAGVIAPTFAAMLYAFGGVPIVILIDLITFLIGAAVILRVKIPAPRKSQQSAEAGDSFWKQAFAGLRYVWQARPLFFIFVLMGSTNFFSAGMQVLRIPYIMARSGNDEVLLGILMSAGSIGAIAGTILMSIWGGFRPRIHNIIPPLILIGAMLVLLGTQRTPLLLVIPVIIASIAPPMINSSLISILQIKVPPDLQGRVFAAIQQISMILMPLSYLVAGPIADHIMEPAAQPGWVFEGLVGSGTGAGIGMMHVISGTALIAIAGGFYLWRYVRNLESILPDYIPQMQIDEQ